MFMLRSFLYFTLFLGILPLLVSAAPDINECHNSTLNNCSSNADCKNTNASFVCSCKPGYEGDGITCNDINECHNSTLNNCSSNAECKNTNASFVCSCKPGYEGDGITCNDINECANSTLYNCPANAVCKNTNGTYICQCKSGYEGNGTICNDINECQNSTLNNCSSNAECKNTNASFVCSCKPGYEGDGIMCNDINECANSTLYNCPANADCKNTNGTYICQCESGYEGNGTICNDINECNNSTLHVCSENANCSNTEGSYNCTCKSGFEGSGTICNDINECDNSTLNNCSPNSDCKNTNASFVCSCKPGYEGNGIMCNDINECHNSTLNNCSSNAECKNTNASFVCSCKSGYEGDGIKCNDINECANSTLYNCPANAVCKNTNGTYICQCESGYEGNGTICNDINECNNSTLHACSENANCSNTEGGYNCTCKSGFEGNGTICNDIDECLFDDQNNCSPLAICNNTKGHFTCACEDGYKGNGTFCEDVDECTDGSARCDKNAACQNVNGSYNCACEKGYRGDGKQCNEIPLLQYTYAINTTNQDMMYGPYDMYSDIHAFGLFFSTVYVSKNGYISLGSDPQIHAQPLANYSFPKKVVIFAPFWAALDLSAKGKIFVDDYKICKPNDKDTLSEIGESIPNFTARRALVITWENVSPYPASEFGNETITFQAVLVSNEKQLYVMFNYDAEKIHLNEEANDRQVLIGYLAGKGKFANLTSEKDVYEWLKPTKGLTGRRFIKEVGNSTENSMVCLDWFCENEGQTPVANAITPPCPCTKQQAERDYTFQSKNNGCYETAFARKDIMQTCCYDAKWGALMLGYPGGGNMYNESADISIGHKHCCTDYKLCNLFYEIYPSNNCSGYKIPTEVLIWDPLIFNFATGGTSVIFYGSGEYNLINADRLKLQARIELEKNQFTSAFLSEIPVYTAFAIKFDQDKFEFTTDGTSIFNTSPSTSNIIKVEKISLGEMLVHTPIMQMKVMLNGGNLGVALFVPASEDLTQFGLMSGALQNGTILDKSPVENIYKTFEDWKVSSQNDSLFTYTSAKNFSAINSRKVDLKQFQDISANLTQQLQDNINRSTAMCGQRKIYCQLDLLLKNKTTILSAEKAQVENQEILGNFPPVFEGTSQAILVYKSISMEVQAKDPENGAIAMTLDTQLRKNTYQFEQNKFNWTLNSTQLPNPSYVKFFASDVSNATSLYWPEVFLCTCKHRSECQQNSMNNKRRLRFSPRMYRLPCVCKEGSTGRNCEITVAPCSFTTCYPNVGCNASRPGNPCGPCPPGMEGNGVNCYDINQCSKGVCAHNCKDLLGNGYICSCWPGYALAADNRTCIDIDECQDENNCTKGGQYCANKNGSYDCKCKSGYFQQNSNCLSLKGKTKLGCSLEFLAVRNTAQDWSEDLTNNSSPHFKRLAGVLKDSLLTVLPKDKIDVLEVTSFEKVASQQKRKKRATSQDSIKGNYEVIGTNVNAKQLKNLLQNNCHGASCKIGNLRGISPTSFTVQAAPICQNSPCDPVSTVCVEKTNGYQCNCKPGFKFWAQYNYIRCKDIDECALATKPCGSVTCNNTVGSYACICGFGFVFNNNTKKCDDVCSKNICNQGICIKNADNFRCSCKVGWIGEKCDKEDSESEKMKTNLIIVGAVLGSFCLIFLLIIIIMCCRSKSEKSSELAQYYNTDTTWSGLPRARLRDVEMNENGSRLDLTKNSNHYESLPGMLNPAFDHDDSRVERC